MTEACFAEGRAPSIELQSVFERFRAWIISVYRRLVALNVDLTDEVRGVMDRMIAAVDEIAEARRIAEMGPLFTAARDPGLSEGDLPSCWTGPLMRRSLAAPWRGAWARRTVS